MIEHVVLDPCSCHQGGRIDDFELVIGETNDLLLAKALKRPADVNVSKTERLTRGPGSAAGEWSHPARPEAGGEV
jgi:hypothetical protein